MTFDQLRYLAAVAKTNNIGTASKSLAISPSAISHALNALATELGVPILIRVGRNIALTAKGEQLAAKSRQILGLVDQISDEFRSSDLELSATILVCATSGYPSILAAKAASIMRKRHPKTTIECASSPSIRVIQEILRSNGEIGICYSPQPHPELAAEILTHQRLLVTVRNSHPIFKLPESKRLQALKLYPSAMPMSAFGIENCQQHPALIASGLSSQISFAYDNYETCISYLRESDAWSFIPEFYIGEKSSHLKEATKLRKEAVTPITLIYHKKRGINAATRAFITHLKSLKNCEK